MTQILKLSDGDFKMTIIKMLKNLEQKVNNIHDTEQIGNFSIEIEKF